MKPRVLFINESPGNPRFYINSLPPLGILGIASYLKKNGISVKVTDYNVKGGLSVDPNSFDIIGFSLNMANISKSIETIRYFKRQNPKVKILVGGPSCIANPEYFTKNENIDAICTREGEESTLEYIAQESFVSGKEIRGLHVRTKKGRFVYGGDREYLGDLDVLPFPAIDMLHIKKYNVPIRKASPISSIVTSRGCPFHCIFCFHSMGYRWRARSPVNVVDEIEWQVRALGIREICIQDDNFSLDINRAKQICELILERNIKVKLQFQNGIRVDYIDRDLLKKMHMAGVWLVGVAPETGSLEVMRKIRKGLDLGRVKQVVQWCKEIGINTYSYFMIGFPFETKHDLEKTAAFVKELDTDFMQLSRTAVLPRTPLYKALYSQDRSIESAFSQEQGCFFGTPKIKMKEISNKETVLIIKKIHRDFYVKPDKMIKLANILSLRELIKLFVYSVITKNL